MFKHLFFDLDRTLWDFETNSRVVLEKIHQEFNLTYLTENPKKFIRTYEKHNALLWNKLGRNEIDKQTLRTQRFENTLIDLGKSNPDIEKPDIALIHALSDYYIRESPRQTVIFPNVIETLTELKKLGYQLHIITNGFREVQEVKLSCSGLAAFFDIVVCSEDTQYHKPQKAIFTHALNLANALPEHSIMIGDDVKNDISGALNSGMQAILFESNPGAFRKKNQINNFDELIVVLAQISGI